MRTPTGRVLVSTVHLPCDHIGGRFETMVFRCDEAGEVEDWGGLDCERTTTALAAEAQHAAMVAKWKGA